MSSCKAVGLAGGAMTWRARSWRRVIRLPGWRRRPRSTRMTVTSFLVAAVGRRVHGGPGWGRRGPPPFGALLGLVQGESSAISALPGGAVLLNTAVILVGSLDSGYIRGSEDSSATTHTARPPQLHSPCHCCQPRGTFLFRSLGQLSPMWPCLPELLRMSNRRKPLCSYLKMYHLFLLFKTLITRN